MTIQAFKAEFGRHRDLAERAIHPLALERLREALDPETNSIAVIVKHVGGNLRSRWTDPFATDGEKPWRVRDREFVDDFADRAALLAAWEAGILPLNYARKRGFALQISAALHYNSSRRAAAEPLSARILPAGDRMAKHVKRRIPKFTKLRGIGCAMSDRITTDLTIKALTMAIERGQPPAGLMHHSDRGSQYASHAFRQVLAAHSMRESMSRQGDVYDNASWKGASERSRRN